MFILKQLRRKKNISQTDLAHAIGVSLRTIQLYEKKEANIPIKNLTKIARFFNLSIADLYTYEVNEADEPYQPLNKLSRAGQQLTQVGIGKFLIQVPLVSAERQKAFVSNFGTAQNRSELSKIAFVIEEIEDRLYVAFEITNNSMDNGRIEGAPNKSLVLGKAVAIKELENEHRKRPDHLWILVGKQTIMCKQIIDYQKENNSIRCHSLNPSPEYSDFTLALNDIQGLFQIVKKQIN